MGIYGHERVLNIICIKLSPEEGVVIEVVVKIYLVFPRASEGPFMHSGDAQM